MNTSGDERITTDAEVVIIGAGMAGVSTAYHIADRHGVERVVLVDSRPPLTLTSDQSTECYRNWWPNASMVGLMNRSIDLLEEMSQESGDIFALRRPGYLFVTANAETFEDMGRRAERTSSFGAGEVRYHPGPVPYSEARDGVDHGHRGTDLGHKTGGVPHRMILIFIDLLRKFATNKTQKSTHPFDCFSGLVDRRAELTLVFEVTRRGVLEQLHGDSLHTNTELLRLTQLKFLVKRSESLVGG